MEGGGARGKNWTIFGEERMINRERVEKYFKRVDNGLYVTIDRERESLYALTSHTPQVGFRKRLRNYVLEIDE